MEIKNNLIYVTTLISILILIVSIGNLNYNLENKKEKETPKLAIIDYGVASNEKYLRPEFTIKNTGYVPLTYNVYASEITNISFYNSSNGKLIKIDDNHTNPNTYYNKGGIILPGATSHFYFAIQNLNPINESYFYEASIVFGIEYWGKENPSNICRLHSVYIFNSIQQIPFTKEESISCT